MKNATAWVQALPVANPLDACAQLISNLEALNRESTPPRQRFALLEEVSRPAVDVLTGLERSLVDVSFPLRVRQQATAEKADSLRSLLFEGYEQVFSDADPPEDRLLLRHLPGLWSHAAHRMMFYALGLLRERQRLIARNDDGLWARVHGAFRLLLQKKVHHQRYPILGVNEGKKSIELLYKEVLLISLIPLQEIHRDQREEITHNLGTWADRIKLLEGDTGEHKTSIDYIVDFYKDQGPLRYGGEGGSCPREQLLLLDTSRLAAYLRAQTRDRQQQMPSPQRLSMRTLELLGKVCKPGGGRQANRKAVREPLDVYFSFVGAHYHLQEESEDAGGAASNLPAGEHIDLADLNPGQRFVANSPSNRAASMAVFHPDAEVLDVSTSGMRIEFDSGQHLSVRVGDIVAVRRDAAESAQIGQVRWLEIIAGSRLSAGIHFWCRKPQPVTLILRGSDGTRSSLPAILGEHIPTGKLLLVVSYLPGIQKKRLNLIKSGGRLPIKLARRPLEYSQAFAAYEFGIPSGWRDGRHQQITNLSLRGLDALFRKSAHVS